MKPEDLFKAARKAREQSYSPYSEHRVGAAVLAKSGKIYTAGNIENCCYALTVCAERAAFYHAIACGEKEFKALAVTNGGVEKLVPCGACRQVIWELGGNISIYLFDRSGRYTMKKCAELYPVPYKKKHKGRLARHMVK